MLDNTFFSYTDRNPDVRGRSILNVPGSHPPCTASPVLGTVQTIAESGHHTDERFKATTGSSDRTAIITATRDKSSKSIPRLNLSSCNRWTYINIFFVIGLAGSVVGLYIRHQRLELKLSHVEKVLARIDAAVEPHILDQKANVNIWPSMNIEAFKQFCKSFSIDCNEMKFYEGKRGAVGAPGDPGKNGEPGSPGLQGTPGSPGSPGSQGQQGPPGEPGSIGPEGRRGLIGLRGLPGTPGPPGPPAKYGTCTVPCNGELRPLNADQTEPVCQVKCIESL